MPMPTWAGLTKKSYENKFLTSPDAFEIRITGFSSFFLAIYTIDAGNSFFKWKLLFNPWFLGRNWSPPWPWTLKNGVWRFSPKPLKLLDWFASVTVRCPCPVSVICVYLPWKIGHDINKSPQIFALCFWRPLIAFLFCPRWSKERNSMVRSCSKPWLKTAPLNLGQKWSKRCREAEDWRKC